MPCRSPDASQGASIVCIDVIVLVKDAIAHRVAMEHDFRWAGALGERDDILGRLVELSPISFGWTSTCREWMHSRSCAGSVSNRPQSAS